MHRLALSLGWSVDFLKDNMTAVEFRQWQRYYFQEPFGDAAMMTQLSVIGAAICNSMGAKVKPSNLMISSEKNNKNVMSAEGFIAMTKLMGGKINGD